MKKPHIIILNPDEMRSDTLGHLGNKASSTPRLDQFANEDAVSFRNAYCQNPVCVPSRCSFFTGLYPHVHGHRTMQYLLHENESSLFSELKDAGYYVWMNARNDLIAGQIEGLEQKHADEVFYGKMKRGQKRTPVNHDQSDLYLHYEGIGEIPSHDYDDTAAACERILNWKDQDKPLCLFLGWINPHVPYVTDKEHYDRVRPDLMKERIRFQETSGKSEMIGRLREYTGGDQCPEEKWQEIRRIYLAQCSLIDDYFGMVCDALKQAGMYDDSAIFFLSDHGDFTGDYDLPEKAQNTFEDCLSKVPLMIKAPKGYQTDPGITDSLAELVDFYATALEYAGAASGHDHFGRSLQPVVEDRRSSVRDYVHCEGGRNPGEEHCDEWHAGGPQGPKESDAYWPKKTAQKIDSAHEKAAMVFDGRYKYVHRLSGRDELYDLVNDEGERTNIIATAPAEKLNELKNEILSWYQSTCDVVPHSYDRRLTSGKNWAMVSPICPPAKAEKYKAAIKGLDIKAAIAKCMAMRSSEQ